MEKNMVMCINTETGDTKPFPISEVAKPYFVTTGYRKMTYEEEALYNSKSDELQLLIAQEKTATTGKPSVPEKARKDFEAFVNGQKDPELLKQVKPKYPEQWQTELIDARIAELEVKTVAEEKETPKNTNK